MIFVQDIEKLCLCRAFCFRVAENAGPYKGTEVRYSRTVGDAGPYRMTERAVQFVKKRCPIDFFLFCGIIQLIEELEFDKGRHPNEKSKAS